jgi:CubicO group peptidase (beta-lactamase class C family)
LPSRQLRRIINPAIREPAASHEFHRPVPKEAEVLGLTRREMLGNLISLAAGRTLVARSAGAEDRAFAAADRVIEALLDGCQVAGASLAVAHKGQVVLANGYQLANVARDERVQP